MPDEAGLLRKLCKVRPYAERIQNSRFSVYSWHTQLQIFLAREAGDLCSVKGDQGEP